MPKIILRAVNQAECSTLLPGFDLADRYETEAPPGMDAPAAAAKLFARLPGWIAWLLDMRNRLVAVMPFHRIIVPATLKRL